MQAVYIGEKHQLGTQTQIVDSLEAAKAQIPMDLGAVLKRLHEKQRVVKFLHSHIACKDKILQRVSTDKQAHMNELQKYKNEDSALKIKNAELEIELETLKEKISQLTTENHTLKDNVNEDLIQTHVAEIERLRNDLQEAEGKAAKCIEEAAQCEAKKEALYALVEDCGQQIIEHYKEVIHLTDQLKDLDCQLEILGTLPARDVEHSNVKKYIRREKQELKEKLKQQQKKIYLVNCLKLQTQLEIRNLREEDVTAARLTSTEIDEYECDELFEERDKLRGSLQQQIDEVERIREKMEDLKTKQQVKRELEVFEEQINKLKSRLLQVDGEAEGLQQQLEETTLLQSGGTDGLKHHFQKQYNPPADERKALRDAQNSWSSVCYMYRYASCMAQEKKLPHREEKVVSLKRSLAQKGTAPETAEYNIFKADVELIEEEIKEMQLKEGKKKVEDLKSKFQEKDRDHIDTEFVSDAYMSKLQGNLIAERLPSVELQDYVVLDIDNQLEKQEHLLWKQPSSQQCHLTIDLEDERNWTQEHQDDLPKTCSFLRVVPFFKELGKWICAIGCRIFRHLNRPLNI